MLFHKLINNKYYFYTFFVLIWFLIQLVSTNWMTTFSENCLTPDEHSYIEAAKTIIKGGYPWFRAVIYPMLLAPFIYFFGENGTIGILAVIQTICWLLTIRLIFKTLCFWGVKDRLAFVGSTLYALTVSNVLTTNHLLTETIYSFLLILSLYIFGRWLKDGNYKYTGYIFIILVLSALIRTLGLHFYYASMIILIIGLVRRNYNLIPYFVISAVLLIGHVFLMKKNHNTTQVCLGKNWTLYHYLFMKVEQYPDLNPSKHVKSFFERSVLLDDSIKNEPYFFAVRDSIYNQRMSTLFASQKYALLKTIYVNFKDEILIGYNHSCAPMWVYKVSGMQHLISIVSIPICCLLLLFASLKRKLYREEIIWLGICFGITIYICFGSSLVFWYGDRLHLPFYPFLIYMLLIAGTKLLHMPIEEIEKNHGKQK